MAVDINWSGGVECQYGEPPCYDGCDDTVDVAVNVEHHLCKSSLEVEVCENYDGDDLEYSYLSEHFTPMELFKELENYIEKEISIIDKVACSSRYKKLKRMLEDCKGWNDDETIVEEA